MGRFIRYTICVVAVSLLSGCYDSFGDGGSEPTDDTPTPNVTTQQLSEMLESESLIIYDDMIVQGSVTSTDRNGNFYKSFIIERYGYGLEILEGLYDSYVHHDVGCVVSIKLQGLIISRYLGVLRVGVIPDEGSYYTSDYMSSDVVIDEHIFSSNEYEIIEPHVVEIGELDEDMCGRLICVESLQHLPSDSDTQPYTWEGYQQFVDNYGNSIWSYTSEYANFSLLSIPQDRVCLCGILQWGSISGVSGGEQYILKMRGVDDCINETEGEE